MQITLLYVCFDLQASRTLFAVYSDLQAVVDMVTLKNIRAFSQPFIPVVAYLLTLLPH